MRARDTIFDSRAERELFSAIEGAWEPAFRLYPHVPYANLIDLDPHRLSAEELSFLHKTTVDFALATREGRPLLGVEFDGLGHGVSRHGRYVQGVPVKKDKNRGWKLDLKTRVARDAAFAFVVISYDEKAVIDDETNLTILHGIVGSFVAAQHIAPRVQELIKEQEEWLAELPPAEVDEQIQDMVLAAELDAEMEWNPITRRSAELGTELLRLGEPLASSCGYLEDPPRPANCYPHAPDFDAEAALRWFRGLRRIGCRYSVKTSRGTVTRDVWLRNFEGTGVTPFGLLSEVAELVTARAALALVRGEAGADAPASRERDSQEGAE